MAWFEDLRSAGVLIYKAERDVPYKEDRSKGPPSTGGYGTVSRATRSSGIPLIGEQQVYASKRIEIRSPEHQKEIAQEIKFLRQCQHRNIVQLEEAYIINHPNWAHNIYLVTKPWAQLSFEQFIQDFASNDGHSKLCPWFKPQILDPWPSIVRQCLSGLAYLHSDHPGFGPIRHKDIKPDNIVLHTDFHSSGEPEVRAIIIDLGISKEHIHGATTANNGTYQWLAPEQIKNENSKVKCRNATLASDVFSLGCCFALIESILRPWPSLQKVYKAGLQTGDCRFANQVNGVNDLLQHQDVESVGLGGPGLGFFRSKFRGLVQDMLTTEPDRRPSASQALDNINRIDSDLARFLDNPTLELCITLWKKDTILVEVDLSKFKTEGSLVEELHRRYMDAAIRHHWRFALPFYDIYTVNFVRFTVQNPDCPTVEIEEHSAPPSPTASHLAYMMENSGSRYTDDLHLERYHESDLCDRIPKKFGQSSLNQLADKRRPVYGRGLEITERSDGISVVLFGGLIFLVYNVFSSVLWFLKTKNAQEAFTVFGYQVFPLTLLSFTLSPYVGRNLLPRRWRRMKVKVH